MKSAAAFLIRASALLFGLALATDLYVSTTGSDSNAGNSAGQPFRTLTKAQNAVRALATQSMSDDITVHLASGIYILSEPLRFNGADSGKNGHTVSWVGDGATLSGGLRVTGWKQESNGIYSASVPTGTESRNLYVGGWAANYARTKLDNRTQFTYTANGMTWSDSRYDWLMSTPGIANAEIRFINSFTDRVAPIRAVGNRQLSMRQYAWANQIIGWDHAASPFADFGVYVQNALALLTDGGEFYLDTAAAKVYYKPLAGENMATIDTYLGVQETLIAVGGTYGEPAHDISFSGIKFSHSTWLKPGKGYGYVDQQTGGYIGDNKTWPEFEASRPWWYQMPSAIQISAAAKINMTGCTYTLLGAGGVGIGNDANAHITGVGLGTSDISVRDGYFTQVMGNSITAGGLRADAHHPSDSRMVNTRITIAGNIFYNNSALYSSTVPILTTYVQYSTVSHNDISVTPYSGLCHGYGWGSNDAGGSVEYTNRGLYKYQPLYQTPTTIKNNLLDGNLIHGYGYLHTDLGGIYTLSDSPGTVINGNYMYDSNYFGLYPDEASSMSLYTNNDCFSNGGWFSPNDYNVNQGTGNMTVIDNWGKAGSTLDGFPNGTGRRGNTYIRNFVVKDVASTSAIGQKVAYRAGVLPGKRAGRPVTNQNTLADAYISLSSSGGNVRVNVTNFDDVSFTNVKFTMSASNGALTASDVPTSIPANSFAIATYKFSGSGTPAVSASATYTNPRAGWTRTISKTG